MIGRARARVRRRTRRHYIKGREGRDKKKEVIVDLIHISIPDKLRIKELYYLIDKARDDLYEFQRKLEDKCFKELGIKRHISNRVEFVGGRAIVYHWVNKVNIIIKEFDKSKLTSKKSKE